MKTGTRFSSVLSENRMDYGRKNKSRIFPFILKGNKKPEWRKTISVIRDNYHHIDMIKTGMLLKDKILLAGYSVKEIQEELHLSCPQPIYRWFKGRVLPSLDHLYVLSRLLKVHTEELIVPETPWDGRELSSAGKRLSLYWRRLGKNAARLD